MNKFYTCQKCGNKTADYLGNCECEVTMEKKEFDGLCPKCNGVCTEIETSQVIDHYGSRHGDCLMQCTKCKLKMKVYSIWYCEVE